MRNPRDAALLGVIASLGRIARVIIRERRNLAKIPPSVMAIIIALGCWAGIG